MQDAGSKSADGPRLEQAATLTTLPAAKHYFEAKHPGGGPIRGFYRLVGAMASLLAFKENSVLAADTRASATNLASCSTLNRREVEGIYRELSRVGIDGEYLAFEIAEATRRGLAPPPEERDLVINNKPDRVNGSRQPGADTVQAPPVLHGIVGEHDRAPARNCVGMRASGCLYVASHNLADGPVLHAGLHPYADGFWGQHAYMNELDDGSRETVDLVEALADFGLGRPPGPVVPNSTDGVVFGLAAALNNAAYRLDDGSLLGADAIESGRLFHRMRIVGAASNGQRAAEPDWVGERASSVDQARLASPFGEILLDMPIDRPAEIDFRISRTNLLSDQAILDDGPHKVRGHWRYWRLVPPELLPAEVRQAGPISYFLVNAWAELELGSWMPTTQLFRIPATADPSRYLLLDDVDPRTDPKEVTRAISRCERDATRFRDGAAFRAKAYLAHSVGLQTNGGLTWPSHQAHGVVAAAAANLTQYAAVL
jgi:hypothetical protein